MSERPTAAGAARRVGSGTSRLGRAWKALPNESRLAAYASGALFFTLFLPWYQVTLIAPAKAEKLQSASASITGWGAFSFVEAAVLIVAAGVLMLLFQRAEGRAFHLPGGDGGVILAAGLWTCVLIVWRIFDKQGATTSGPSATTSGIEWGIFVALAAAAFLAYAGSRIRAARRPEPPLPGEENAPASASAAARTVGETATNLRYATTSAAADAQTTIEVRRATTGAGAGRARSDGAGAGRARADAAPEAAPQPAPDRPRRRPSAAELFERVVPEDPPTMPFGRAKPADANPTLRMAARPPADGAASEPTPPDDQLTMPLGNDDDTLPLDRNR